MKSSAVVLVLVLASVSETRAQGEGVDLDKQVHALVRELGDKEFAKREAARKALLQLGPRAAAVLDKMKPPSDLETQLRLRKIRYQIVGFAEDLEKYLHAMPASSDEKLRHELTQELQGLIASHRPRTGDLLLKYILDPKHPLQRNAVNALVQSFPSLTAGQIDAYIRHALTFQSKARAQFVRGVDGMIGMTYYCRYGWGGWPAEKIFTLKTKTTHYLDGQPYGSPFHYQGPIATTGWIRTKDLSEGRHSYYFTVDYEFTHDGTTVRNQLRSEDYSFEMLPACAPDNLIAPADTEIDKIVRQGLRFFDRDPAKEELFLGQDHMVDPWFPQVSWVEGGKHFNLRVPIWKVEKPLPVDLCFEAEVLDLKSGKWYRAAPVILHKGSARYGYVCPDDVRAFTRDRSGMIDVKIRLTPSRAQALTDPDIRRYYSAGITSEALRMKLTQGE